MDYVLAVLVSVTAVVNGVNLWLAWQRFRRP